MGKLEKKDTKPIYFLHDGCLRVIVFILILCFTFSSVVEAKRSVSPRHASRHVSGVQKKVSRVTLRKKRQVIAPRKHREAVASRKRPQRSQRASSGVNIRQARTSGVRNRTQRPLHLRSSLPRKSSRSPVATQPSPLQSPLTYLKPHTQKNIQLGGLDSLYTKHLEGQGQTIAIVELSGTWGKLRDAIVNPNNTLTAKKRENFKNNFLPAVGDPLLRLHPEEKNPWINLADKNVDHGASVASVALDLAPQAKVLPVSTFNTPQSPEAYDVADAIMDLSQREEVNIINISAGDIRSTVNSREERDAKGILKYASKTVFTPKLAEAFKASAQTGKVIVLAAGNRGQDIRPPQFTQSSEVAFRRKVMGHLVEALDPETLKSVIFAGNLDPKTGILCESSNKPGNWAEAQERFLCAPGEHALPDRDQHVYGTSYSAPYICAAVANLCSKPGVTPKRAVQALLETADQRPDKAIYGRGIIRADRALEWLEQGN